MYQLAYSGARGSALSIWKGRYMVPLTPLVIRVPTRVMKPLTLSDRSEDNTSVEPGSFGANKSAHSVRPSLNDVRDSCSDFRSHFNSLAYSKCNRN